MKWTVETITAESKKYDSISEWRKNSNSSMVLACKLGIYGDLSKEMKRCQKWTKDAVIEEARKYSTKSEWKKKSSGSYYAANINFYIDECATHMKKAGRSSAAELEILAHVKKYHPDAKKARFGKRLKGNSGNGLELDVFVQKIKRGVEFNGEYWHGKGFKPKSWAKTPKEYSTYKKIFFESLGINFIEIEEKDWLVNRLECLSRIDSFLNGGL